MHTFLHRDDHFVVCNHIKELFRTDDLDKAMALVAYLNGGGHASDQWDGVELL